MQAGKNAGGHTVAGDAMRTRVGLARRLLPPRTRMSILVVEAPAPSSGLAAQLGAHGWITVSAGDRETGLALLDAHLDVAVVVTDDTDGAGVIRACAERRGVPVVVCDAPIATDVLVSRVEASLAVTLEPATDVQARLAIDAGTYERLVARFSALAARTADALPPDASASSDESLVALAEAALLVGARRVTTALARLRAADGDARGEAMRGLQFELRRVSAAIGVVA